MEAQSLAGLSFFFVTLTANAVTVFSQLEGQLIDFYPAVVATSSSLPTGGLHPPQWAIEGSSERKQHSCFVSNLETDPWWRLNLMKVTEIFNVRVISAIHPPLPDGLVVYVSNGSSVDNCEERAQCGDTLMSNSVFSVTTFHCSLKLLGRYIYITTPKSIAQLALCEVILNVQSGSNKALDLKSIHAEAIQSSGESDSRAAELAIDGDSTYLENKCSSTTTGFKQFLRVDLKRPHLVKQVSVKFYGDGGNATSVQVGGNLLDAGNYKCGNSLLYQSNSEDFYNFSCAEAQLGQYVIVTSNNIAPLQICEVQVFTDSILDIYNPGSVTASSQYFTDWEIWKTVDRFRSTTSRACYRSLRDMESYWKLELTQLKTISMIKITSEHRHNYRDDLERSRIYIGNKTTSRGQDNALCGTVTSTNSSIFIYIQCDNILTGKYIYVISGGKSYHSLVLCEVELYRPGTPDVTLTPLSQQVVAGANFSLTCSAVGTPKITLIMWKLGNTPVSGPNIHTLNVKINEATKMSTLTLVESTTSGNYTCEATNSEGTVTSNTAVITVMRSPTVAAVASQVTVVEGSNATLQVIVRGVVPNVSISRLWIGPNYTLIISDSKYSLSSDRRVLTIRRVTLADGGTYKFFAINAAGQGTVTFILRIKVFCDRPSSPLNGKIVGTGQKRRFRVGMRVYYVCNRGYTLSSPENRLRKCLPNKLWSGTAPYCYKFECSRCHQDSDCVSGAYCRCKNGNIGSGIFCCPRDMSGEVAVVGATTLLRCDRSCNVSFEYVTWYKDGQPLDLSKSPYGLLKSGLIFYIENVIPSDAGEYMCEVHVAGTTYQRLTSLKVLQNFRGCSMDCGKSCARKPLVAGGKKTYAGQYPWQAMLCSPHHGQYCGGILVSSDCILTAAHCLFTQKELDRVSVCLGRHCGNCSEIERGARGSPQCFRIQSHGVHVHHQFREDNFDNDIAVIKTSQPLVLDCADVFPVCLPNQKRDGSYIQASKTGVVTGWGRMNSTSERSTCLLEGSVRLAAPSVCDMEQSVAETMICARDYNGACEGDSGGPLVVQNPDYGDRYVLAGITSWGTGCGNAKTVGGYASVLSHLNWIKIKCGIQE